MFKWVSFMVFPFQRCVIIKVCGSKVWLVRFVVCEFVILKKLVVIRTAGALKNFIFKRFAVNCASLQIKLSSFESIIQIITIADLLLYTPHQDEGWWSHSAGHALTSSEGHSGPGGSEGSNPPAQTRHMLYLIMVILKYVL